MNTHPINGTTPVNGNAPQTFTFTLDVATTMTEYGTGQAFLVAGIPTTIHLPPLPLRTLKAPLVPNPMKVVTRDRTMRAPSCDRTMFAPQAEHE